MLLNELDRKVLLRLRLSRQNGGPPQIAAIVLREIIVDPSDSQKCHGPRRGLMLPSSQKKFG
jgi:hypothetical protein